MEIDLVNLVIQIIIAVGPAYIAYKKAMKNNEAKFKEMKEKHEQEIEKMEKELDLKKEHETTSIQNEIARKVFTGEVSLEGIMDLKKQAEKYQK